MFKGLSMESRNTQTQNCAPIQCTVLPRNVVSKVLKTNLILQSMMTVLFDGQPKVRDCVKSRTLPESVRTEKKRDDLQMYTLVSK